MNEKSSTYLMQKHTFQDLVYKLGNNQIIDIYNEINTKMSKENTGTSSKRKGKSHSYAYCSYIPHIFRSWKHYLLNRVIIDKMQEYLIKPTRFYMNSFKYFPMEIGYRIHPGETEILFKKVKVPIYFFLNHSIGLSYYRRPLHTEGIFHLSSLGAGLLGVVKKKFNKVLVEIVTNYNGMNARFIVLVILGIGCTVWFTVTNYADPGCSLHPHIDSYEPFLNMNHYAPGHNRIGFIERYDVTAAVESCLEKEHPFSDIKINATGKTLTSVGLGIMIAIFLTVGLVPDVIGDLNVQL